MTLNSYTSGIALNLMVVLRFVYYGAYFPICHTHFHVITIMYEEKHF